MCAYFFNLWKNYQYFTQMHCHFVYFMLMFWIVLLIIFLIVFDDHMEKLQSSHFKTANCVWHSFVIIWADVLRFNLLHQSKRSNFCSTSIVSLSSLTIKVLRFRPTENNSLLRFWQRFWYLPVKLGPRTWWKSSLAFALYVIESRCMYRRPDSGYA